MSTDSYLTGGGIRVHRTVERDPRRDAIEPIVDALDARRGVLLASSYEYPGRYTRWDMGFVDPPLALVARGRALARRGAERARAGAARPPSPARSAPSTRSRASSRTRRRRSRSTVRAPAAGFAEEERSRQPSVFSRAARARSRSSATPTSRTSGSTAPSATTSPSSSSRSALRLARPADQRDLVLYLPDELIIVDHRREVAQRRRYDFEVDGRATDGLPRERRGRARTRAPPRVPRAGDHEPGEYAAIVRRGARGLQARRPVRGRARPDLLRAVPLAAVGALPPPARAQPRALRVPDEPRATPSTWSAPRPRCTCAWTATASRPARSRARSRAAATPIGDAAQILALLNSAKDESELTMCTDVDRNDKSRICVPGSVRVIGRRQIEMYARLIHTVDHVEGRLRPGFDALDAFLAHTWAVTVTGAPEGVGDAVHRGPRAVAARLVRRRGRAPRLRRQPQHRAHPAHHPRQGRRGRGARRAPPCSTTPTPTPRRRRRALKASAFLDALRRPRGVDGGARGVEAPRPGRGAARAAGRPPGLVRPHAGELPAPDRRRGGHAARAGFPPSALDDAAARPGGALARPRAPRATSTCPGTLGARSARGHPDLRRLPRAAGHRRALRRRARRARLPDARQGLAHPRARRARSSPGCPREFTAGRYHSLFAIREKLPADARR